ncbi:MAG: sodium:solute symporter family transporter [Anaerolineales bacterium]|jgi:SSS family solute:Na+ symporter
MQMHWIDLGIITLYLIFVALIGFWVQKRATQHLDGYYLAGRNVPWWMLGLSGCSSYIDIGGTMALVGAMFYLGLKSIWITHIFWGWLIICFYMAFQAKYIRRSGVMTFAEWNETRFGTDRDAEYARIAAATFLLVLMIFNLMFMAVGTGKFAEEFLPFGRWQSALLVFGVVGIYVTLGGFFGVILTDVFQTLLIAVGAIILGVMAFNTGSGTDFLIGKNPGWSSLAPVWKLWPSYLSDTPAAYQHYNAFGTILLAGFAWLIFRVLAGPNVWDFQFFLTTRSPRDASLAAGMWTVGYTLRWIIGCAFLILGIYYLGSEAGFDAEKIMPLVLKKLPIGLSGLFMAILLAALMSTLSAMVNVTSSVVTNDFLKRYFTKNLGQKQLVRLGQVASIFAITLAFLFSLYFKDIVSAWETMIFVVVTMILAPATMRWHWWRFSAKAFVWSMILSAGVILVQKLFFNTWSAQLSLSFDTISSVIISLLLGFVFKPTDTEVLLKFYSKVRPFGFWKPIRLEAEKRGLIPVKDSMPKYDILNGFLTVIFQVSLALIPFFLFLRQWKNMIAWLFVFAIMGVFLYFTWYKKLPSPEEV